MKKTLTVNIGGMVFYIDDDAFGILNRYLEEIKSFLNQSPNRDEILADIENRIAELFKERIHDKKESVVKEDVRYVIETLGQPGEFGDEEETVTGGKGSSGKRLYRNVDERMIGGVCAGLGSYFNMDPAWVRIIFVVALVLSGASLLAYIILWIVLPPAITEEQKREMRGGAVDFSHLEESFKTEMDEVSKKLEELVEKFRDSFMKKQK